MELITIVGTSLAAGVLGGYLGHVIGTRLVRASGGYEDHEERIALIENLARTIQRAQKAQRMRELRSEAPPDSAGNGTVDPNGAFPWPTPAPSDPKAVKAQLRARVFTAKRGTTQ